MFLFERILGNEVSKIGLYVCMIEKGIWKN